MSTSPVSDPVSATANELEAERLAQIAQKNYRRFNGGLLTILLGSLLTVGAFNWLVNPYGIYARAPRAIWNHEKPKTETNDRLYKAARIIELQPAVIFLGSSRTKQGLDPRHPYFGDRSQTGEIYNLALNGPNVFEVRRYLEHAITNQQNLERVILGIDFFMFNADLANQPTFLDERLSKRHLVAADKLNTLFSWDALMASIESLQLSRIPLDADSSAPSWGFAPNRQATGTKILNWRFDGGIRLYFQLHRHFELSDEYMAEFAKIVEICREQDIELDIFISPAHVSQWEALRATGRWDLFEGWKRQIVEITPVWDFSGYHTISSEPITPERKNYVDNSHYQPEIGALLLNRILDYDTEALPDDFGVWLTPSNIDEHLATIRQERAAWSSAYPDQIKWINRLYREVQKENGELSAADTER